MRLQSERVLPVSQSDPPDLDSWNSKHPPFIMRFDMTLTRRLTCLLLTSTAVACASESELDAPEVTLRDGNGAGGGFPDRDHEVCDLSNQVVVFNGPSTCGSVGNWSGERIFDAPGNTPVPSGLARYCRYTHDTPGATQNQVDALSTNLGSGGNGPGAGLEIGTDCRAVETQNSAIVGVVGDELDDQFAWLSGRFDPQEVTGDPALVIHTAIVDTYPSNPDTTEVPYSTHGPVVASIIESMLCPAGFGCTHKVRNYLGLPRTNEALNRPRGGQVGFQSDLARGIYEALLADQLLVDADRLVINLSVAWESERYGGTSLTDDMGPASRSVYDAIRIARCRGALIIAAAGNQSGLSCTGEPMAPGRWEEIPAPDEAECIGLGITNPYVDPAPYTPLVHAVGGLFSANAEMATSRAAGMPRLAAASSHAVAHPRDGLDDIVVRTGSSVGTAVASASASLVWGYAPGLSPSGVMQKLYEGGQAVGDLTADFGLSGSPDVHRIDACAAVGLVIPGSGPECDFPSQPVTIAQIAADVAAAVSISHNVTVDPGLLCTDVCGSDYNFHPVAASGLDCDDIEPDPWRWLIAPQPTESGCQECILTTDSSTNQATALLTLANGFVQDDIKSVSIEIQDVDGKPHIFGITDKDLSAAATVHPRTGEIDGFDVPMSLGAVAPQSAYILMNFLNPKDPAGESIATRDALILKVD